MLGRRSFLMILALFAAALPAPLTAVRAADQTLSPEEARAIAKEAYIYGFPLVDNYRVQYSYFVDKSDPEYKAPWNTPSTPRASTPPRTRRSRRRIPTRPIRSSARI